MKPLLTLFLFLFTAYTLSAQQPDTRYFELRIYYCHPGRLDALVERFQNHTTRIFEKHGMENIGYWLPVTNDRNALYYILAYPGKNARKASWTAFGADPEWKEVAAKSEAGGKIVGSVTSVFMNSSDILPAINTASTSEARVFELRTYTCLPARLPNLITRFKDHTVKLFEKHGMQNISYYTSEEAEGVQPKLIYLLGHKNQEEAVKSWAGFRADPEWITARDASEKDGKIVEKVESVFLKPLGFSKIR